MLRRLLKYSERGYGLREIVERVRDQRERPQIKTSVVFGSVLLMALCRLRSLNALEQHQRNRGVEQWVGGKAPSADTVGRVYACLENEGIRQGMKEIYLQLKRNKVLKAPWHGWIALVVDGHELTASELRCCKDCLQRRLKKKGGE